MRGRGGQLGVENEILRASMKLKLSDITVDYAMQIRAGMDEPTVNFIWVG